jgi:biotin carboxyl carrier protein
VEADIELNGRLHRIRIRKVNEDYAVTINDREWLVNVVLIGGHMVSLLMDPTKGDRTSGVPGPLRPCGASHEVLVVPEGEPGRLRVDIGAASASAGLDGRRRSGRKEEGGSAGPQHVVAPMPGRIVRILVSPGDTVRARQPIVVVEAMKMENELRAARDGRVTDVMVTDGQAVEAGMSLVVIADR